MASRRPVVVVAVVVIVLVARVTALARAGTPTPVLSEHSVGEVDVLTSIVSHAEAAGVAAGFVGFIVVNPIGFVRARGFWFCFASFRGRNMVAVAIAALGQ